ncbi:Spc98 family protein [Lindgomyces ingoldianus]|uniref:Spc98 family protein n=1 Tax=Lindgomyces ingoldianus TaxID=673940 RepID=A0ACB6R3L2_9PLEO|nr:Spc98 family protein [Lindgomyces ingoldianus]KAF2473834.1 Spc98 family protein [Lindgomyces ingoldianus]
MLHEILLSLSGHPSALFDTRHSTSHVTSALLSPSEAELLSSLAHLSHLHRRTRDHVVHVAASHPSTICRAVATAIASHHLDKFQQKVLDVESRVLKKDASTVGAYGIVPLAGLVSEFSEWTKLMEWLWYISDFMMTSDVSKNTNREEQADHNVAAGAELIDKLRVEAQTGYPDIEAASVYLGRVAETSWLRQLSTWLLYGRLPSFGASDFFIRTEEEDGESSFVLDHKILPKFVTRQTASSMLFIGKSLNQVRSLGSSKALKVPISGASGLELLPVHVGHLSEVTAPISSAKLSGAVANIRLSLSRNLLQHLLPREKIVEILGVLHQFFLLGRGEFPVALIAEADEKIQSRHRSPAHVQKTQGFQGILLKEAEINNALSRSWSVLSSLTGEEDRTDDALDLAIDILHLTLQTPSSQRPGTPGRARESTTALPVLSNVAFNDLLLSAPISLTMDIRSPLDLFLTKSDLEAYSVINSYLLAIRRAHLHLAQLWRHSSIRREHPPPPNYQFSNSKEGRAILDRRRQRNNSRSREMRKVWATCAAAIFFLSESEAYFQGEVVQESYKHFLHWFIDPTSPQSTTGIFQDDSNLSSSDVPGSFRKSSSYRERHHDPETLASAHRQFLGSLSFSLLLTDVTFTRIIRDFFTHVDELVAFITRLHSVRQNLDLEEDDGVEDFLKNYKQEEKDVGIELDRSRRRLDGDMKSLISRLRDIDAERLGSTPNLGSLGSREEGGYEPLRLGGVDRLLMKLDWGITEDEEKSND